MGRLPALCLPAAVCLLLAGLLAALLAGFLQGNASGGGGALTQAVRRQLRAQPQTPFDGLRLLEPRR